MLARVDALHPQLMSKFGGHAMAAGLSLPEKNIERFKSVFIEVTEQMTRGKDWQQVMWTDGELQLQDFTIELADQLGKSNPWGQAFAEPVFEGDFKVLETRVVGDKHLKMTLAPVVEQGESGKVIDAIFFFYLDKYPDLPVGIVRLAYQLNVNEFRNQKSLQIMVRHIEILEVNDQHS